MLPGLFCFTRAVTRWGWLILLGLLWAWRRQTPTPPAPPPPSPSGGGTLSPPPRRKPLTVIQARIAPGYRTLTAALQRDPMIAGIEG